MRCSARRIRRGDTLINWARGLDLDNENNNAAIFHGDAPYRARRRRALARPVAINFGTDVAPKVVVFYGGNDGVLRAINGNRTDAHWHRAASGSELWSFMPPEFYGQIKRIRDNKIQISYPNITTGNPLPKPCGMDGAVTAIRERQQYRDLRNHATPVVARCTAFNVNRSDPSDITLKWKRGCPNAADDTGCSTGFTSIGQTWASPKPLTAQGYASPILIMGGGYDRCEDADPQTCTAPKGNRIFVLDADTGTLLTSFTTVRSVVADVVVIPDNTGLRAIRLRDGPRRQRLSHRHRLGSARGLGDDADRGTGLRHSDGVQRQSQVHVRA